MDPKANPNKPQDLSEKDWNFLKSIGMIRDNKVKITQVGPKKYYMPGLVGQYSDEIFNFPIREDDVWVVTLPRSGTTLTQELVWQICNDLDFDNKIPLTERFPFFEFPIIAPFEKMLQENKDYPENCEKIRKLMVLPWKQQYNPNKRRFLKTHLPLSMLPPELLTLNCKVVYVARNLGDNLVSRYHHIKMFGNPVPENFEDFVTLGEKGLLYGFPYFENILEAWNLRNHKNLLFLFYEDIVKKPEETIKKVVQFFGKTLNQNQINRLIEHIKFDNFKNNESVSKGHADILGAKTNNHVRKGQVGSCNEELFTVELRERLNKYVEENLKKTDLRFPSL